MYEVYALQYSKHVLSFLLPVINLALLSVFHFLLEILVDR